MAGGIRDRVRAVPRSLCVVLAVALALRVAWVVYAAREPADLRRPVHLHAAGAPHRDGPRVRTALLDRADRVPPARLSRVAGGHRLDREARRARTSRAAAHRPRAGAARHRVGRARVRDRAPALFNPRIALIAAALTACFPNLVFYTALMYSETLYTVRRAARGLARRARRMVTGAVARVCSSRWGSSWASARLVRPFALLALIALGVAVWRAGATPARSAARGRDRGRDRGARARSVDDSQRVRATTRSCRSRRTSATRCASTTARAPTADSGSCRPSARSRTPTQRSSARCRTDANEPQENSHNLRYAVVVGVPPSGARGRCSCSGARSTATATITTG